MNRDDDQHLWDILGRAAPTRLSPFFSRNVLRQVRQQPRLLGRAPAWLTFKLAIPASAVAVAVMAAVILFRGSSSSTETPVTTPEPVVAVQVPTPAPELQRNVEALVIRPEAPANFDAQSSETDALAQIDVQDYDTVANLDDLLILYETNLWEENSSL